MSTVADPSGSARRLPAGRKAELAAYVAEAGQVTVAKLAEHFDVSADTIRRDLDQLDTEGVLIRTHGGAISLSGVPRPDTGMDVRMRIQTAAKEKIGAIAATLVDDGAALMINGGSTTLAVVRHLREHHDLTVATNSLQIPAEIAPGAFRDLYVFGGAVRPSAQATVGPVGFPIGPGKEREVRCDLALIAVGGISAEVGYSTSNLGEATMMNAMMDRATRVAVLADSSKFGRRLFAQVAELGRADYLITDTMPPTDLREALEAQHVQVLIPDEAGPASAV
jgi:DeoR/GlpR family transcriptional regulator of sugar metabolism